MNMIYKKALKDLWASKSKTVLILTALIIGLFGMSTIIYTYTITKRDLKDNYLQTNPASVNIKCKGLSNKALEVVNDVDYVSVAEVRDQAMVRARSNSTYNWMPLLVFSAPDLRDLKQKTFKLEEGRFPNLNEILIERDGLRYLDDDDLTVQLNDHTEVVIERVGTTHDPGRAPSHMEHMLYGYVDASTFDKHFRKSDQSRLLVKFQKNDLASIEQATIDVIKILKSNEVEVLYYNIPPPNKHPHEGQLESLLFLQVGMGSLAVLLSILLLINVIDSIMSEQIKQIGIMKSIGASRGQLIKMYTLGICVMTLIAILISLPMAYKLALWYSTFIANELNFDVLNAAIPWRVNLPLIVICFLLPVLATIKPILKACGISAKAALNYENNGIVTKSKNASSVKGFGFVSLWMKVAINNCLLSKSRLALSIFTLMLGLALFSVGLNVSNSLDNTFQKNMDRKHFDFTINLKAYNSQENIADALKGFSEISEMEVWTRSSGNFIDENGVELNGFGVVGIKEETKMWDMLIIEGELPSSWNQSIVVNPQFLNKFPNVHQGDSIQLSIGGELKL